MAEYSVIPCVTVANTGSNFVVVLLFVCFIFPFHAALFLSLLVGWLVGLLVSLSTLRVPSISSESTNTITTCPLPSFYFGSTGLVTQSVGLSCLSQSSERDMCGEEEIEEPQLKLVV